MRVIELKVKRLVEEAVMPKKAHYDDAGFDLVAVSKKWDEKNMCFVYGTGLAFEIPVGYVGLVFPRSSVANRPLYLANCVGVIDSGYRGEVTAKFRLDGAGGDEPYEVGERIAQMVIVELPYVKMVEADELGMSARGEGGYGSTGR